MKRSEFRVRTLNKKFSTENNDTIFDLFKQKKRYLFIKFANSISFRKKRSYKQIRSIVFDVPV